MPKWVTRHKRQNRWQKEPGTLIRKVNIGTKKSNPFCKAKLRAQCALVGEEENIPRTRAVLNTYMSHNISFTSYRATF